MEETLQRLRQCVEEAKYFEALQQYKSLAARRKPEAAEVLCSGAIAMLTHRQGEEGFELGMLLV
eukprot:CAMPEP_0173394150 /NCGR_PEP_ID=MMETSP1356-20130122/25548_1 /TAXON_ID=77927 ORGANISM="Hemiselmis virescens, Strain PCC157" /NCGR_SAMPLE_ID=MMETSP1356 /ASSEMBLY_ACC=CAM_ASM_000847 /LENGTH=63 /DNA_ID=CAMNT_0014352379 /DNA_START=20 /DNA_END=207 /DNA_ORIENTATION=-